MEGTTPSTGIDVSALAPFSALWNAIYLISPLVMLAFIAAGIIHLVVALAAKRKNPPGDTTPFSYVLVACLSGVILGMFVKLLGGLDALLEAGADTSIGTIASAIVVALGATAGVVSDAKVGTMSKPIGSLGMLICLLIAAFYWKVM